MNRDSSLSTANRRRFLKTSAILAGACAGLNTLPRAAGFHSANARPRIGVIGCGSRWGWQLANGGSYGVGPDFARFADYVAVCDVDKDRVAAAQGLVKDWNGVSPAVSGDYRRLIERDDIDAILVFTPDHWHAKIAIEAMLAGKDVYCEKPMTLTIHEGQQVCDVCRKTDRVVQIGTQQRSSRLFWTAIALVQSGRLGKLTKVECGIGGAPTSPAIPAAKPPANLDWNQWLGPAPLVDYRYLAGANNETKSWSRCHYEFRWWYEYSGGKLTDWGAHHVDIATWAMGKTETGPVEVKPVSVKHPVSFRDGFPVESDCYNTATEFLFKVRYEDGLEMTISSEARNGILLEGTEGRIFVNRGSLSGASVEALKNNPLPSGALEKVNKGRPVENEGFGSLSHVRDFFESATALRQPISDVFSHHRALTTCHLAAIAGRLGRTIRWDPANERVIDDALAQSMLQREKRAGFTIDM
jgi:predicted dehydrogenase